MTVYDYVIVGGGTAGCVLANRLSADPKVSVAMVEHGPNRNSRRLLVRVPAGIVAIFAPYMAFLGGGKWLSRHLSAPEPGMLGRSFDMARGRAVGGSSTINGMAYVRGQREDFDHWAALGNAGWNYEALLPYFRKIETFEAIVSPASAAHLTLGGKPLAPQIDPAFHGASGPVNIAPIRSLNPLASVFLAAAQNLGLPLNPDYNGAHQNGVGYYWYTQQRGWRHGAEAAYIDPIRHRPNLTIISDTRVERLLLEGKRAVGALGVQARQPFEIRARREVILSAGAFASPHLLLLSGIGDRSQLQEHGIEVVHHLPGVGENLQDHVTTTVKYRAKTRLPYGLSWRALPRNAGHVFDWLFRRRGAFGSTTSEAAAFIATDPATERPNLQLFFNVSLGTIDGLRSLFGHGWLVWICDLRPRSRGHVRLRSADPAIPPEIQFNFFCTESSPQALIAGIRQVRAIMAQPDFAPHFAAELAPGPGVQTDAALDVYVRATSVPFNHSVGTCRMGHDEMAVVDPATLKVHGIDGLRVIDASVMPEIVSGNTMAATYCIAEKGADMLLGKSA